MYEKIKTEPTETTLTIFNDGLIMCGDNTDYFFVDFNKLAKYFYQNLSTKKLFEEFKHALNMINITPVSMNYVITPQWALCTYTVNGVEDSFVIYADSYTAKVRTNFSHIKTSNYYIEPDTQQKSKVYFMGKKGICQRIDELLIKQNEINSEISRLNNKKNNIHHELINLKSCINF